MALRGSVAGFFLPTSASATVALISINTFASLYSRLSTKGLKRARQLRAKRLHGILVLSFTAALQWSAVIICLVYLLSIFLGFLFYMFADFFPSLEVLYYISDLSLLYHPPTWGIYIAALVIFIRLIPICGYIRKLRNSQSRAPIALLFPFFATLSILICSALGVEIGSNLVGNISVDWTSCYKFSNSNGHVEGEMAVQNSTLEDKVIPLTSWSMIALPRPIGNGAELRIRTPDPSDQSSSDSTSVADNMPVRLISSDRMTSAVVRSGQLTLFRFISIDQYTSNKDPLSLECQGFQQRSDPLRLQP